MTGSDGASKVAADPSVGLEARRQACRCLSEASAYVTKLVETDEHAPGLKEDRSTRPEDALRAMRTIAEHSCAALIECASLYESTEPETAADRKAAKRAAKKGAKKKKAPIATDPLRPADSKDAATARLRAAAFTGLAHLLAHEGSAPRVAKLVGGGFARAAARQLSEEGRAATPAVEFPRVARKVALAYVRRAESFL